MKPSSALTSSKARRNTLSGSVPSSKQPAIRRSSVASQKQQQQQQQQRDVTSRLSLVARPAPPPSSSSSSFVEDGITGRKSLAATLFGNSRSDGGGGGGNFFDDLLNGIDKKVVAPLERARRKSVATSAPTASATAPAAAALSIAADSSSKKSTVERRKTIGAAAPAAADVKSKRSSISVSSKKAVAFEDQYQQQQQQQQQYRQKQNHQQISAIKEGGGMVEEEEEEEEEEEQQQREQEEQDRSTASAEAAKKLFVAYVSNNSNSNRASRPPPLLESSATASTLLSAASSTSPMNSEQQTIFLLEGRIRAQESTAATQASHIEVITKSRGALQRQLDELKAIHVATLANNSSLEVELSASRQLISTLKTDVQQHRLLAQAAESDSSQLAVAKSQSIEIETLKLQLQHVRHQLVEKRLQDEFGMSDGGDQSSANGGGASFASDREVQGKRVYESIIGDLRSDLASSNAKLDSCSKALDESLRKLALFDQMRDELSIYKDTTSRAASTHLDVNERNAKSMQENAQLSLDLSKAQSELQRASADISRLTEELAGEREKFRAAHLEACTLGVKTAELYALKTKAEVALEEHKQSFAVEALLVENLQNSLRDVTNREKDLRTRVDEGIHLQTEHNALQIKLAAAKNAAALREQELLGQVALALQSQHIAEKENETLRERMQAQQRSFQESLFDGDRLRKQTLVLEEELEDQKRENRLHVSSKKEQELNSLRFSLDETVAEWRETSMNATASEKKAERRGMGELSTPEVARRSSSSSSSNSHVSSPPSFSFGGAGNAPSIIMPRFLASGGSNVLSGDGEESSTRRSTAPQGVNGSLNRSNKSSDATSREIDEIRRRRAEREATLRKEIAKSRSAFQQQAGNVYVEGSASQSSSSLKPTRTDFARASNSISFSR